MKLIRSTLSMYASFSSRELFESEGAREVGLFLSRALFNGSSGVVHSEVGLIE